MQASGSDAHLLEQYRRKRDPAATPEPFGRRSARGPTGPRFVVQRHSARRLHYDLRLEQGGVLRSWAVPKGLPLEPGSRRRAIHTEDHPLAYLEFEGVIPRGQYGGGVMDIYDRGSYALLEESRSGSLTFRLEGARLAGTWTLTPARLEGDERNWLLIRRDGSRRLRRDLRPMLPTKASVLPRGNWTYELAWGGVRTLARVHEGDVTLWGAGGKETTESYARVAQRLGRGVRVFDCVLDGEICALDARGRPSRALLRSGDGALTYVVYDLLELDGESLLSRPLEERQELLRTLHDPSEATVRVSDGFADGPALTAFVREHRLGAIVAKRLASPYVPAARSGDWVEVPVAAPAAASATSVALEPGEARLERGRRSLNLSRLEYLWWPESATRKADLVDYYRQVAPVLLPHLRRRPFTLKRYLNGPKAPFEWVKDAPEELPEWIPRCPLPAKSRGGALLDYPLVDDELALLWMIDYGCIDLHLWYSRCDRPQRPDFVLFDLDPAGVEFADVIEAARLLHELLTLLGLRSFVRTSGGDGLHVQVPVARRYTYAETRRFAELVADALRRARPDLVTTERKLSKRHGVFVDTKMNGEGMTIVSPYSVRPLPGPPVATPLEWNELEPGLDPRTFTLRRVLERVAEHGDLHASLLTTSQRLEPALARVGA
jgi:bifunctional non-homologous end joining protein LigD